MNGLACLTMNTFQDRLNERMQSLGLKPVDIVRATKASKGTVSQWVNGIAEPSSKFSFKLATFLKCDFNWLMEGEGLPPSLSNTEIGPELQSSIPIIGFATAGAFQHVRELEPHEVSDIIESTYKQNGYRFALRIKGSSMENPSDPKSVPDGSIVIFNAAKKEPEIGQLVLAKLEGSDETTFKKFTKDGENYILEPLNPRYDIITKPFRVLATAEEMTKRL